MKTTALALAIGCGIMCGRAWGQDRASAAAVATVARGEPAASRTIPVPAMAALNRTELAGGLIVEDLKIGEGYEVKPGGAIVAHFQGTVKAEFGKVFDSTFARGEPGAFSLAGAFPGWDRGVPGMRVGGVRRLTVPAAMAKGLKADGVEVAANSDLVFVLQVLDALRIEDLKVGAGDLTAGPRCVAIMAYTITDKDGKVIEKHDSRDPYIWMPDEYRAMALGLEGMKPGGKRRIHVPAAFNRANPKFESTRPEKTPVTIEVELFNVKNVPPAGPAGNDC